MQNSPPNSIALSVIIVSYNTREMTLDCLRVLKADLGAANLSARSEIWVVDNASQDGSIEAIGEQFPDVHLIENPRNDGFGAANNLALKQARGEYFLLLNSDAFPVARAIETLLETARAHPEAAVVGPRLLNADGSLQMSCWKFPSPARVWLENLGVAALLPHHPIVGDYYRWAHDTERIVDFVIGACLLVRRAAYLQVGGFDERFWMYAEETDWQRRLTEAGWKVLFTPRAQVTHLGGASGASDAARVNEAFWDSLDRYGRKHHGKGGLLSLRLARLLGSSLRALSYAALALLPPRRERAWPKARFHWWLARRQLTRRRAGATARKTLNKGTR